MKILKFYILIIAASFFMQMCSPALAEKTEPLVKDMSHGQIEVTFSAAPSQVKLDRDVLLTIKVSAPSEIDVTLPALHDRLQGFTLRGTFDKDPIESNGKITQERHVMLTPLLANEYRIAPMPIIHIDKSKSPAEKAWFATQPIVFKVIDPYTGDPGTDINTSLKPVWIRPTLKMISLAFAAIIALIIVLILSRNFLRKVQMKIKLMTMSPKERALKELEILLEKNLIAKDKIKEFYLELTMIVRRYIEKRHRVRAPEQTTEEFLEAISSDSRFTREVIDKLQTFLESADLVKFAAHRPTNETAEKAADTARVYVESDDKEQQARNKHV